MRWLLVLALLAGRATAGPCGDNTAFPENGATGVPTKTFVWFRSDLPGPYALTSRDSEVRWTDGPSRSPLTLLAPGPLAPNHEYKLTANGVVVSTFTTGGEAAMEPPVVPVVGHLRLIDGLIDMSVWSPRAAMLHVSVHRDKPDGEQLAEVWIPRSGLTNVDLAACTGVTVTPGDTLCFWVSSVTYSSSESGVTARCVVDKAPHHKRMVPMHDVAQTPPSSSGDELLLVVIVVLALLFVGGRATRERLYAKVCEPQPIEREAVAWIARRQLTRRLVALAVIAAAAYVVLPIAALGVVVADDVRRLFGVARAVATGWPVIADPARRRAYVTDGIYFGGWISVRPRDLARVAAAHIPRARVR